MKVINSKTNAVIYEGQYITEAAQSPSEFFEIDGNFRIELDSEEIKAHIRKDLGDPISILGTVADASQLSTYVSAQLIASDSFADFQRKMTAFKPLAQAFLAKVESGEVVLPFMLKGVESVMSDIEQRSNQTTAALKKHIPQE